MVQPESDGRAGGGWPVVILDEDVIESRGRDAQSMIIAAGMAVAEAVRSTLGPRGMDKMLVDDIGDVIITNDGATILDEMDVDHPAAKLVIEVAEAQEAEVGDGTTTAIVLAGALLQAADELLEDGLHPQTLAAGYRRATDLAVDRLESISTAVDADDDEALAMIARTALTGKNLGGALDHFADLAVRTVQVLEQGDDIDLDNLELMAEPGAPMVDSFLVDGVVVDKERLHVNMPDRVKDATVGLLEAPLDVEQSTVGSTVAVDDAAGLREAVGDEEAQVREKVAAIAETGIDVLFCDGEVSDFAQHLLVQADILTVRKPKARHMRRLAAATGAEIVSSIDDLGLDTLGTAGLVEQRRIGEKDWVFVEETANSGTAVPIVRGGSEVVVDDAERALDDAIDVVAAALEDGAILPGGGAPEIEAALALRDAADRLASREQLVVRSYAEALERIPRTLATNGGLDPIDAVVDLRRRHTEGDEAAGLHLETGGSHDAREAGIVEPLRVKRGAIESASEAAVMLLRIDDVVSPPIESIQEEEDIPPPPGGHMGGPAPQPGGADGSP